MGFLKIYRQTNATYVTLKECRNDTVLLFYIIHVTFYSFTAHLYKSNLLHG
uniref:Uncharacterized protein n=1 Tax=Scytodes thoracica TaxID=1112478 RepID=A0A0A0V705_SCYTH|nr:hypothetical protein [Scytodes thoracica]